MEKSICPKCGDELMQEVNSTNKNCVRCGETVRQSVITIKPEEKAKELIEKYKAFQLKPMDDFVTEIGRYQRAKDSALMCVFEILEQLNAMRNNFNEGHMLGCGNHTLVKIRYWEDVKQEIEKRKLPD